MNNYFSDTPESVVLSKRILYTATAFAKSNLLFLQEIGSLAAKKPHKSIRSNLRSYLFFVVKSGSGTLKYKQKEYSLAEGDMILLDCSLPYSHETDENNLWQLSWIHFYGDMMPAIYDKYISRGGQPVFHPENATKYVDLINSLYDIAASDDYIRDMRINASLNQLLVYLMEESWHPEECGELKKQNLLPIKEYLDSHFNEKVLLDEISEKFGISKYYLTRVFKEQFGMSINSYLLQTRITKAKNMLRFTDEKVENIGRECGLGEPNYFSRTFKMVEGITPSEYRQRW